MRVISVKHLHDFYKRHPRATSALQAWLHEAQTSTWKTPLDIKARYASASIIGRDRVVFNIKGNDYRLVVAMAYPFGASYVKFIGTHAQYDAIDALTVEMS